MSQLSPYQLRLEQIAIWGDAAYNTRTRNSISSQHVGQQEKYPITNQLTTPKVRFDVSPSTSSISEDKSSMSLSSTSTTETQLRQDREKRGSFSQCHTTSAERFRCSGRYHALLLATKRREQYNHVKTSKPNLNLPQRPDVEIVESDHFILTKRTSMSTKEIKMETRVRGRKSGFRQSFRSRRRSSIQPLVADEINPIVFDPDSIITMKQNMQMRERDESEFRKSNAKLPERESTSTKTVRASMPSLGRFTRSTAGQIPTRRPYSATM